MPKSQNVCIPIRRSSRRRSSAVSRSSTRTGTCRSTKLFSSRQARLKTLEALEDRAKQFRGREGTWPFRVPHEPVAFDPSALQPRVVLRFEWPDTRWELWAIGLPSGLLLYCDSDGREAHVLASVKRGSPAEADGFFLERLAESRGECFGIEMTGPAPERIRSSIGV